jgi:hypothetical protein
MIGDFMKLGAKMPTRQLKRRRGTPFSLSRRDIEIMQYIWRWKIASTRSVHEANNRDASEYSTYKILDRLERNHMLECRYNMAERFHVWQLTEYGFESIRQYLGDLKEEGYLSENHRHDRLVQAFQLGEWATHQFKEATFFTEQEMRRLPVENYPEWVPQTADHRADGYTRLVGCSRTWTLAYEVELTAKNVQKYESVLRFYRASRAVDRVLWLVGSPEVRATILRAKSCIKDDSANFHVFVDLADYIKNGWDARVTNERSETLFTLREKYRGILGEIPGEILGNGRGHSTVTVHLKNQKVIGKSKSCRASPLGTSS